MNDRADQLEWEARWGPAAAVAAFLAAIFFIGQQVLVQGALEDRPGIRPLPDFLLSVDESPGYILGSAAMYAAGALLLIVVFYYLFQAVLAREAALPRWFIYLVYLGPILFALSQVLGAIDRIDLAHDFADGGVVRGEAGDDRADAFIDDNPNVPVFALSFAGLLGLAFLFVMVPLRARRVGLLSPFMGILGVVAGALLVLQLAPQIATIIVAFWLGRPGRAAPRPLARRARPGLGVRPGRALAVRRRAAGAGEAGRARPRRAGGRSRAGRPRGARGARAGGRAARVPQAEAQAALSPRSAR